ncbi:MAG: hypothetical protein ACRERE_09285 [Candidatus Entotheonellia bacterium]
MELLWYGFVVVYALGAAIYFGLSGRTPSCRDCRTSALMLSRQIAGSSPPVFEIVYCCPRCREILWKRFVSPASD